MKKIISVLLLAALLIPMAACASKEKNPSSSNGIGDSKYADSLPETMDFGGQDIKIICAEDETTLLSFEADEDDADIVATAVYERNKLIEQRLNVTIEVVQTVDHENVASTAKTTILAGSDDYDIVAGYQYFSVDLALDGLLYNLKGDIINDIGYLDFTKPYWSTQFIDNISIDNAAYWATGDLSLRYISGMYCTYVNTRIYNEYKDAFGSDIYTVVRNGEWTMDKLIEMSSLAYKDLDGSDSANDGDQFGFITGAYDLLDGLAVGAGVKFSQMDVEGKPYITLGNETSLTFADKLKELTGLESTRVVSVTEQDWCPANFASGNALFLVDKIYTAASNFRDMEDDYAIIPTPKLDTNQATYLTTLHDGITILGIPNSIGGDKLPGICATLEALAAASYTSVTPVYYENALKYKYTRDEDSVEMIDLIRSNVTTDFAFAYSKSLNDIAHYFRDAYSGGSSVLKRKASSSKSAWATALDDILERLSENA